MHKVQKSVPDSQIYLLIAIDIRDKLKLLNAVFFKLLVNPIILSINYYF